MENNDNELIGIDCKGKKTIVSRKRAEILQEIKKTWNELQEKKDAAEMAKNNYYNTPWYHPIKRAQNKKKSKEAMDNLTMANSETIIQILKIIGEVVEFAFFCFLIPMDLIERMGRWVCDGFSRRDAATAELIDYVSSMDNPKPNILKGFLRIIFIVVLVLFLVFIANKIFFHKDKEIQAPVNNESDSSETIELMKKKIDDLEKTLKDLKEDKKEVSQDNFPSTNVISENEDERNTQTEIAVDNDSTIKDSNRELNDRIENQTNDVAQYAQDNNSKVEISDLSKVNEINLEEFKDQIQKETSDKDTDFENETLPIGDSATKESLQNNFIEEKTNSEITENKPEQNESEISSISSDDEVEFQMDAITNEGDQSVFENSHITEDSKSQESLQNNLIEESQISDLINETDNSKADLEESEPLNSDVASTVAENNIEFQAENQNLTVEEGKQIAEESNGKAENAETSFESETEESKNDETQISEKNNSDSKTSISENTENIEKPKQNIFLKILKIVGIIIGVIILLGIILVIIGSKLS